MLAVPPGHYVKTGKHGKTRHFLHACRNSNRQAWRKIGISCMPAEKRQAWRKQGKNAGLSMLAVFHIVPGKPASMAGGAPTGSQT
jgi:hypothetical protein